VQRGMAIAEMEFCERAGWPAAIASRKASAQPTSGGDLSRLGASRGRQKK
jgi:hypothetical protein